ncbi:hypothetical protein ACVFYP_05890 [Roseomonas sp. F4]
MSAAGLLPAWRLAPPSRPVAGEPILGIRALRYEAEGRPGALPAIAGLRLQPVGIASVARSFDPVTGLSFLQELPPGPRRILVTDPERRFLPAAMTIDIPSRFPERPTLGGGEAAPLPRLTIRLRPSPSRAVPVGMTAVIGQLRDAQGRGIALGRLECATVLQGEPARVVTWTDSEGGFALLLSGEAPRLDAPPPPPVIRALKVSRPSAALAAALAADFTAGQPDDLDLMTEAQLAALFTPCVVRPQAADGQAADAAPGHLPIRPGRTMRWDLMVD